MWVLQIHKFVEDMAFTRPLQVPSLSSSPGLKPHATTSRLVGEGFHPRLTPQKKGGQSEIQIWNLRYVDKTQHVLFWYTCQIYITFQYMIYHIYTYYKYEILRERERFVIRKTYYSFWYGLDCQSFLGGYFSISSHLAFLFKNSSNKKSTPSQSILCFGGSQSHIASPSLIVLPFLGDPRVGCSQRRYSILWIPMALHASASQVFKQSEISWQLPKFEDVGNAPCGGYIRVVRLSDSQKKKKQARKTPTKAPKSFLSQGF